MEPLLSNQPHFLIKKRLSEYKAAGLLLNCPETEAFVSSHVLANWIFAEKSPFLSKCDIRACCGTKTGPWTRSLCLSYVLTWKESQFCVTHRMEAVSGGSETAITACNNCQVLFACCVFEWGETVSFCVLLCVNVTFTSWRCKSFHVSHVRHFCAQMVKGDCWECCLPQPFYPERLRNIFKCPIVRYLVGILRPWRLLHII